VIIELGELREAPAFGDDQPDDVLAARAENLTHEEIRDHLRDRARGNVRKRRGLDGAHHRAEHRAH
jgi:hypothetical protein